MSNRARSIPSTVGQPTPYPRDDAGLNDFERSSQDSPIDDPGDAQHSSKSEPDGDGEETE